MLGNLESMDSTTYVIPLFENCKRIFLKKAKSSLIENDAFALHREQEGTKDGYTSQMIREFECSVPVFIDS